MARSRTAPAKTILDGCVFMSVIQITQGRVGQNSRRSWLSRKDASLSTWLSASEFQIGMKPGGRGKVEVDAAISCPLESIRISDARTN